MKNYDIFLFDADNTLYDFDRAVANALEVLFSTHRFSYSPNIPGRFIDIGMALWERYESGDMTDIELQHTRFSQLFQECGITHCPVEFTEQYHYELGKCAFLIDGAEEICKTLTNAGKQIYIITNGFLATYQARVKHSAIEKYVTECFVSEIIGYKKPRKEFFDYVLSHLAQVDKSNMLIVGDSLGADIAGGNAMGIDTCWFNLHNVANKTEILPTYEIQKLSELAKGLD